MMNGTVHENHGEGEPDFIVVEAPPGAAASQGGTGEIIVFRGPRLPASAATDVPPVLPSTTDTVESAGDFTGVKPGDTVYREFYGHVMSLVVTSVDDELIYTGDDGWMFDRRTGFEHDPEIGVGWRFGVTISRLIRPEDSERSPG